MKNLKEQGISGTRKVELLIESDKLDLIWKIRLFLGGFDKASASKRIIDAIKTTPNNEELLKIYEKGVDKK